MFTLIEHGRTMIRKRLFTIFPYYLGPFSGRNLVHRVLFPEFGASHMSLRALLSYISGWLALRTSKRRAMISVAILARVRT